MFGVVADPMVIRFRLPERFTGALQNFVGFAGGESLPTLDDGAKGVIRRRAKNRMDMIRHHDPFIESVAVPVKKRQSSGNKISNCRTFQPAFTFAFVQKSFDLPPEVTVNFFDSFIDPDRCLQRFGGRLLGMVPAKSFCVFCLKLQKDRLR